MNKLIPALFLLCCMGNCFSQNLETVIQQGHELAVLTIAISPDSNYIATGSKDKSIKLWEVISGREIRSFLGHEMSVTTLTFSPDGKYVLSGSNDKSVRIWDISSGRDLHTIVTNDFIKGVAIDPQQKFFIISGYNTTGEQDSAVVYDFKTKVILKKIAIDPDEGRSFGTSVNISPNGEWVAFGENNRTVNVYDTKQWRRIYTFNHDEGFCGGCATFTAISPDNKFLYMASHHGATKKYDLATGKLVFNYENNCDDVTSLAISPDGKKIVRATSFNISVWDEVSGKLLKELPSVEGGNFHQVTFGANSRNIFISCDDNTAYSWNYQSNRIEKNYTGLLNERDRGGLNYDPDQYFESAIAKYVRLKNTLIIANDGETLLKGKFGTKVRQWNVATGKAVMEFTGHKKAVLCYDLSKDGQRLLTGGGDGKIILWDVKSGDSLRVIQTYREPIFDIHFNKDETLAVSSSWDATMKIHELKTGKLQTYIDFESYAAYNLLLHPNDLYIVTARLDHSLQLWEIDTKTVVRNFIGHTDVVSSLAFSKDQQTLLTSSWDGSIRLWNVNSGLMLSKLKGHRGAVHIVKYSADEKLLYSAGADRLIRIWDLASGKNIRNLEGHKAEITSLIFSPDNKMLISYSVDGVTKFWDLTTGKEFFEHIQIGNNDWMVKNPDGYFYGTDNARKYIHFVSGTKTFSVDQFFDDFYRPEILPEIFQSRGGKERSDKSIQGKLNDSPPPAVQVAVVPTQNGKAELYVRITDNGAGVENLKLYHNGKSLPLDLTSLKVPSGKGERSTYKQTIDLVGGNNTFSASARNKKGIESDVNSIEIYSEHSSRSSVCHILAVGINKYKNPRMQLNYAKPDAQSFTEVMDQKSSALFKSIQFHVLYDDDATRDKIMSKMEQLATVIHPEDVFIFYYAGHGSMVDNKFYFIPTESLRLYDASSLNKEAIDANLIQEQFKNIKALKQLIIMDACQSGGSVELLATRGASEEKAIAQLSRSAGIHVMASAGSEQFATEFSELGHGLFTYVLINALKGDADGAPKDGKVTIYELKSYIDDQVPEMTRKLKGKPQYPYTFSRGQDFPVVLTEE